MIPFRIFSHRFRGVKKLNKGAELFQDILNLEEELAILKKANEIMRKHHIYSVPLMMLIEDLHSSEQKVVQKC